MLRLVLWPTDTLWTEIDALYSNFTASVGLYRNSVRLRRQQRVLQETTSSTTATTMTPSIATTSTEHHHNNHTSATLSFHQIGLHFRCGDRSFLLPNLVDNTCIWTVENANGATFQNGDPYHIGICAKELLSNHTSRLIDEHRALLKHLHPNVVNAPPEEGQFVVIFITSDNAKSSLQMMQASGNFSATFVSPDSCHIELKDSYECLLSTVVQWFALSLSGNIVTQQLFSPGSAPSSSFSRYAGIYGLHRDVFRGGLHNCETINNAAIALQTHSNWFCI